MANASPGLPPSPQPKGRRLALELVIGAVLGFVVWSFGGPTIISWWYEPPSRDAFSCAGSVRMALAQFVKMQLGAALFGAVAFALLLFGGRRIFKSSRA
jgi:Mg/Co/Ni transporter MgtE